MQTHNDVVANGARNNVAVLSKWCLLWQITMVVEGDIGVLVGHQKCMKDLDEG